ncbi:MAG TPA: hypothetical protein VKE74_05175, partial [Gemmataceae bacterium]|nr:hypothetical protein [Gemmataceae bacterium]
MPQPPLCFSPCAMAIRPQNACRKCGYTWYPRGKNVSIQCPRCRSSSVEVVVAPTPSVLLVFIVLGIGAALLVLVVGGGLLVGEGNRGARLESTAKGADDLVRANERKPRPEKQESGKPDPPPIRIIQPKAVSAEGVPTPEPLTKPPELVVAPSPRYVHPFPPQGAWLSDWSRIGEVEVRIRGVAVTRVALIDDRGKVSESIEPRLVVWIEIRNVSVAKPREYRRWQSAFNDYCSLTDRDGLPVPTASLGPGKAIHARSEYTQPLPPGG